MEDALHKNEPRRNLEQKPEQPKYMLRTDVRALERAGAANSNAAGNEVEGPPLSWKEQQVREDHGLGQWGQERANHAFGWIWNIEPLAGWLDHVWRRDWLLG